MEVKAKVRQAGDAMKKTLADDYNALDFAGAYKELNFAGAYEKRDPRELNIVGAYKKLNISKHLLLIFIAVVVCVVAIFSAALSRAIAGNTPPKCIDCDGEQSQPSISIHVKTGDLKEFAGSNVEIKVTLFDKDGGKSDGLVLGKASRVFEQDDEHVFEYHAINLGPITRIQMLKTGSDDWFCEKITVKNHVAGTEHPFPVCRWFRHESPILIQEHDASLPQDSVDKPLRKKELEFMKPKFELTIKLEGLLPQIKEVPKADRFSLGYESKLAKVLVGSVIETIAKKLVAPSWNKLADLRTFYNAEGGTFPMPQAAKYDWRSDRYFGWQRVGGVNPVMIKLCRALPAYFPVSNELVQPFLEQMTLQEALSKKRIFIVDLTFLENVTVDHPDKFQMCAPVALFYLNNEHNLMPIAIQLFPHPGSENPIFVPSDPKLKWTLVKMWFNNAEAQVHESTIHLGLTHLLMETISVSAKRQLSPSHPVFRMMAPHFQYLYQINADAFSILMPKDGTFDKLITAGPKGAYEIMRVYLKTWRMDTQGGILSDLKAREVDSPDVLPRYPYRDDAVLLHDAIKTYATEVLTFYYDSPARLADDAEVQAWALELAQPVDDGGCGIQGLPGRGKFDNLDDLITVVTNIIATCSVGHAAVNFNQYDQYGFPAAYPIMLHGNPPQDKENVTEEFIISQLPTKSETTGIMQLTRLLSEKATKSLGDYDVQYLSHPEHIEALQRFRANLEAAGKKMKAAGVSRTFPYNILWPEHIPNAISI